MAHKLFILSALLRKRANDTLSFKTCLGYRRKDDKDSAVGSFIEYLRTFNDYDISDLLCMEVPDEDNPETMDSEEVKKS